MKYMGRNGYGCSRLSTDRGGVVLNISSVQGLMAWPAMPTYSAAKAAMITYTRSAGHHLEHKQHGVAMICLCPGAVNTPMQVYQKYLNFRAKNQQILCLSGLPSVYWND